MGDVTYKINARLSIFIFLCYHRYSKIYIPKGVHRTTARTKFINKYNLNEVMDENNALVVFQDKKIRRIWSNDEWWFVLEDMVFVLTDSSDIKQYINKMRQRDEELSKGWVQFVHTLPIPTSGGEQLMNCVSVKGAFRLIQSIPSKKAEPFKLWLAQVGYERVKEIEDPELAQKRMREL